MSSKRAERLRLVEVAGEADLVAGLDAGRHVPRVGCVRQHLTAKERLHPTLFEERHLLGVSEVGVRLVLDDGGFLAVGGGEERARAGDLPQRPSCGLVLMTGGAVSERTPSSRNVLISFAVYARPASMPSTRSGRSTVTLRYPNASLGNILRLLGLLEGKEGVADAPDVHVGKLAVLVAEVLSQRLVPLRRVDELHFPPSVLGLAVAEHPDVRRDTGVVEHVERQGDNGFQPIILDDPSADVALALSGVAREEGAAIVHLGYPAAERQCPASSC